MTDNNNPEGAFRAGSPTGGLMGAAAIPILLLAVAFATTYWPVVGTLREQWATNDTYSFGVLVPFISGYLIWARRDRLRALPISPGLAAGGAVVAAAAMLLLVGRVTAIVAFEELSLIMMLAGLVLLTLGYQYLRVLTFPLCYLLLMLPVWEFVTDPMHHPSQLFSAGIAAHLLNAAGVPVFRDGVYLHLPNITLEVASACSGINFLIAVLAIGIPQAHLYLRGWLPRVAVILFAVAIALFSNGVRVALIGVLSHYHISEGLHGPGHVLQGLFVSGIGFVALMASVSVLSRRYGRLPSASSDAGRPSGPRAATGWRAMVGCLGATALLVAVSAIPLDGVVLGSAANFSPPTLSREWRPLPGPVTAHYIAGMTGTQMSAWESEAPAGPRVHLYIGTLVQSAPGGVTYRSVALPDDVSLSQVQLSSADKASLLVNRAVFTNGDRETHVIYWYSLNGRSTTQISAAKAYASVQILTNWTAAPQVVMVVADSAWWTPADHEGLSRLVLDVSGTLSNPGLAR